MILDGTPVVGSDRAEKLIGAIKKAAQKEGGIALEREAFNMPLGADEKSKGYIFVTLQNANEALAFRRALNDYPFDKKHTFKVVPFTEVERYTQLDEQYVAPPAEDWVPRVSTLSAPQLPTLILFLVGTFPRLARRFDWTRSAVTLPSRRRFHRLEHESWCTRIRFRTTCTQNAFSYSPARSPQRCRNGPIRTPNGRRSELYSRRFTVLELPFGEDRLSNPSTDSPTPKSSSSTSRPSNATSSPGRPSRSKLVETPRRPSRKTTKEITSPFGKL